jgi:hypothetical protein
MSPSTSIHHAFLEAGSRFLSRGITKFELERRLGLDDNTCAHYYTLEHLAFPTSLPWLVDDRNVEIV